MVIIVGWSLIWGRKKCKAVKCYMGHWTFGLIIMVVLMRDFTVCSIRTNYCIQNDVEFHLGYDNGFTRLNAVGKDVVSMNYEINQFLSKNFTY